MAESNIDELKIENRELKRSLKNWIKHAKELEGEILHIQGKLKKHQKKLADLSDYMDEVYFIETDITRRGEENE